MKRILYLLTCVLSSAVAQDLQLIVPSGHSRRIIDMDVSADKQWMASVDGSDHVKIWDYVSGAETWQLQGHSGQVTMLHYHPSLPILATGSVDGVVKLWDGNGLLFHNIKTDHADLIKLLFTTGGDTLITIDAHEVSLWHTATAQFISHLKAGIDNLTTATRRGDLIAFGNQSGEVSLVDLQGNLVKALKISDSRVASLALNDQQLIAATDAGELIAADLHNYDDIKKVRAFSTRNYKVIANNEKIHAAGRDDKTNFKSFNYSDLSIFNSSIKLTENPASEAFQLGLRALAFSTDTTLLLGDYDQVIREYDLKNRRWVDRTFRGLAAPVYDLALNHNEQLLAIASGHASVKIIDLTGAAADRLLDGYPGGTRSVDFHPVNPVIATWGMDERIIVKNILSGEHVFELKAKGRYKNTPVAFDPTGRYILRKSSEEDFDFYDFRKRSPKSLKVKNGTDFEFSPDGRRLFFKVKDGITSYDPVQVKETGSITIPEIQDFSFYDDGSFAVLLKDDLTLWFYSADHQKTGEVRLPDSASCDKIYQAGGRLIGLKNSTGRGEAPDFTLKVIDRDGKLIQILPGHSGFTTAVAVVKSRYLFTSATDGQIKLWDLQSREPYKASLIPLNEDQYVVTTPVGLFDATPRAMGLLHYARQGKVIALDQLKDEYYEPNLLAKILGYSHEPMRTVKAVSALSMYPEVAIRHPLKNDGKLGIDLNDNGGGIGRVVILINGKEVSSDVRAASTLEDQSAMEIDYHIEGHPFLYTDRVNKVTIKAYNKDGTLSSEPRSIYLFGEEKVVETPRLFAVIVGTSDYEGDALDLKYAAKDAADFARAIKLSAGRYLGEANVEVTLLTTDLAKDQWPTKENIRAAFQQYSKEATAKDLLLVYLSGHGVNHSGTSSDFYYLTSAAGSGDMGNTTQRESAAISSVEFTNYINTVPALKQILVIDACHSGRMASSLASSRSAMSSTQIRALERMKDRTGMFILAGSAADAVSYETTLFGQGLLTYSLLFGMKGAALRDDEYIDVLQLFQFAANKVPELAEEIGGVQKPEIRLPENGKSFDIGRLETSDRDRIELKAPKPVYVQTRFQDESAIHDHLKVSELMDEKLREISSESDPEIVFVDDKSFSDACTILGRYEEKDGLITARVLLMQRDQEVKSFTVEAVNADLLTDTILKEAVMATGK